MGAGLAKQIATKFPIVKQSYVKAYKKGEIALGVTQVVEVAQSLYVANLAAQDNYGTSTTQTDYSALQACISSIALAYLDLPIYIPYKLGCGLAEGNWDTVLSILKEELKGREWYICKV